MNTTIKKLIALPAAAAIMCSTAAMLPSAEVYGAPVQTAAVLIEANNGLNPPALREYKVTANSATLSWKPVSGAIGYRIYRKVGSNWVKVKTLSSTSYTEKGLAPYSTYQYKVKAYKKKSGKTFWGKASRIQSVTTLPEAPKFKAFSSTKDAVRVNWQGVKCDGYQLYMSENGGAYTKVATIKGASAGTYKVKNLKSGTKYTFKLRAYGRRADNNRVITGAAIVKAKTTVKDNNVQPEYGTVSTEYKGGQAGWVVCNGISVWKNGKWETTTTSSEEAFKFAEPYLTPQKPGTYEGESIEGIVWVYLGK